MKPSVWMPSIRTHEGWSSVDFSCCRAEVSDRMRWAHYSQCSRKAVTEPDEEGLRWCTIHSPEAVEERERKTRATEEAASLRWAFGFFHGKTLRLFAEVVRLAADDPPEEELRRRLRALADEIAAHVK